MQIKANALVVSADGKDVGHVRRVVIDPRTDAISDLVIREGILFTEDRVVPIEMVADTDGERVHLKIDAKAAESLGLFEETYYQPVDGEGRRLPTATFAPAYYWYPPVFGYEPTALSGTAMPEQLGYQLRKERHIPENTVALKEGATVKSRDGHHIGHLEQVLTAPGSDQATHLVLSEGLLHKNHKIIPLDWVDKIAEDEVTLAVAPSVIEKLPVHEH